MATNETAVPAERSDEQRIGELEEALHKEVRNIARVCHGANREYAIGLGDNSHAVFDAAPDWQTNSLFNGVLHRIKNPKSRPGDSHAEWCKQKEREGWTYAEGPKDAVRKTHPNLLPFNELPEAEKKKDVLFLAIVDVLAGPARRIYAELQDLKSVSLATRT